MANLSLGSDCTPFRVILAWQVITGLLTEEAPQKMYNACEGIFCTSKHPRVQPKDRVYDMPLKRCYFFPSSRVRILQVFLPFCLCSIITER